jgi:transposase-like protein
MTMKKYSPELRERAVRMVFEHGSEYPSRWAAIQSIAAKVGCSSEEKAQKKPRTEKAQDTHYSKDRSPGREAQDTHYSTYD